MFGAVLLGIAFRWRQPANTGEAMRGRDRELGGAEKGEEFEDVEPAIELRRDDQPVPVVRPPRTADRVAATRAGGLTREMAADFGPLGIRVNAIAPGEIDTAILSPGTTETIVPHIPMHRLGTTDEVAKIIYVLCTETSSYVNGAEIHINGGQHV